MAEPLGSAKYVVFETAQDKVMEGLNAPFYPWPYVEGVTIEKPPTTWHSSPPACTASPCRRRTAARSGMTLPWKYGFKSAKAIVKITFTDKRPRTFWEAIGPSSTASGRTSTRPCPTRAGARLANGCWAPTKGCLPRFIMVMLSFVAGLYTDHKNREAVHVIAQRILAVISAILLVAAVALGTLGSGGMLLGRALYAFDRDCRSSCMGGWNGTWVTGRGPIWSMPMMVRPAWLLPASLGIICAGLSLSLSNRKSTHRSHRRS